MVKLLFMSLQKSTSPSPPFILLIEDDDDMSQVIAHHLAEKHFKTLRCSTISEARLKLSNQKFAAILLDIKLKSGSGSEIIHFIRNDKNNLNYQTPIMIISGTLVPQLLQKISGQISDILIKPFEMDVLVDRLKKILV